MAESVWEYPRPPRVEPCARRIRVVLGGETIVDTQWSYRVLETSHPPVYYVSSEDVRAGALEPSGGGTTFCEWKGTASYYDAVAGNQRAERAAWTYRDPSPGFEEIRDSVAFYPGRVDACFVDDERVEPQPGDFYGGWITSEIAPCARPESPSGDSGRAKEQRA
jgi:uncharacterized protein (DUF427 family)